MAPVGYIFPFQHSPAIKTVSIRGLTSRVSIEIIKKAKNSIIFFYCCMMDRDAIFDHYRKTKDTRSLFSFEGYLSQNILVELGESLKDLLAERVLSADISKKIFAIFIELAQNIVKYSAEKKIVDNDKNYGYGAIYLSEENENFVLQSGNLVEKDKVLIIRSKCDHIASLNSKELRAYYKRERRMPLSEYSKGAGLGFIDIAMKTNNNLDIVFHPVDEDHSFFIFTIKVNKVQ